MNGLVATRSLWVFDFDGTLSHMTPERDSAGLHPSAGALLGDISRKEGNIVAVLSSRELDDLVERVPIQGVILGGACGLAWHFPGGIRLLPGAPVEARREAARKALDPILNRLSAYPGVEVEDKGWSVAVHYRRVLPDATPMLEPLIKELEEFPRTRTYRGPYAVEVQLFPNVNKYFGLRRLCRLLKFDPSADRLFYAGDDENDAVAMRWVLRKGGTAFIVGGRVHVRGAQEVDDPESLVRAIRGIGNESRRRSAGHDATSLNY